MHCAMLCAGWVLGGWVHCAMLRAGCTALTHARGHRSRAVDRLCKLSFTSSVDWKHTMTHVETCTTLCCMLSEHVDQLCKYYTISFTLTVQSHLFFTDPSKLRVQIDIPVYN